MYFYLYNTLKDIWKDGGRKQDPQGKTNIFEAMTESIKLFVGILIKGNMLVIRKVEVIH